MQPESSDGFASVGTVLPSEEVALLPGGLFLFPAYSALLAPTMDNAERYIAKWQGAGLLDEQSASAIRAYETAQARPSGLRGDSTESEPPRPIQLALSDSSGFHPLRFE